MLLRHIANSNNWAQLVVTLWLF